MGEQATAVRAKTEQAPPPMLSAEDALRRLLEALQASSKPLKMTYEEFLAWAGEDTLAEWVNGEVIMVSPASDRHQDLSDFLTSILRIYTEAHGLGAIRSAPFQVRLARSGREPDLMFIAREHQDRLKENYLDGPADLVVEIVSPDSVGRDRGEKFYEYEEAGIPEYWLLDPQRGRAEFYQRQGDRYHLAFEGREGEYRALMLPGFWLRVEWLWQQPLPSPIRALAEIVGMDAALAEAFERVLTGAASS